MCITKSESCQDSQSRNSKGIYIPCRYLAHYVLIFFFSHRAIFILPRFGYIDSISYFILNDFMWVLVNFTDTSEMDNDGWILGPSGELFFWIPPSYRLGLWRPNNIAVIGRDSWRVDLTDFAHGIHWQECCKV
jgi:hypothetical protein